MKTAETAFQLGQVWRDQDGILWRLVTTERVRGKDWLYVRRHGYPKSQLIQTDPAWLHEWACVA